MFSTQLSGISCLNISGYIDCHSFFWLCIIPSLYRHRLEHQNDRDVSEKIALGQPIKAKSDEGQFDQRLFNQSRVGLERLTLFRSGWALIQSYFVQSLPLSGKGADRRALAN